MVKIEELGYLSFSNMQILNPSILNVDTIAYKSAYAQANPFPYLVIDNFLREDVIHEAYQSFPAQDDPRWVNYKYFNKKLGEISDLNNIPPPISVIMNALNSSPFLNWLEEVTGFSSLIPDADMEVGGINLARKGGFLNVHADFTTHPTNDSLRRRVNILLYLNKDWKEEYNGHLELWDKDMKKCVHRILPKYNRCIVFSTEKNCLHGYPEPISCEDGNGRKSINLYYFTKEAEQLGNYATTFKPSKKDIMTKSLVFVENFALNMYHQTRARVGIQDKTLLRLLGYMKKRKK